MYHIFLWDDSNILSIHSSIHLPTHCTNTDWVSQTLSQAPGALCSWWRKEPQTMTIFEWLVDSPNGGKPVYWTHESKNSKHLGNKMKQLYFAWGIWRSLPQSIKTELDFARKTGEVALGSEESIDCIIIWKHREYSGPETEVLVWIAQGDGRRLTTATDVPRLTLCRQWEPGRIIFWWRETGSDMVLQRIPLLAT